MSVYGATKGFDLLFGEGLAQELRGSGIDVLVLNPGSTSTEFGKVAGSTGGGLSMRPERVVAGAIRALGRKVVYVPGMANKLVVLVDRIFPRGFVAYMSGRTLRKITPPEHR
jgi:short-subunit dehydrogenase